MKLFAPEPLRISRSAMCSNMFSGLRKQLKELEKLKIGNPAFVGAPQAHKVSRGPKRPASEDATRKSSRLKATPPVLDKGGDEGQERENIGRMISKVKNDAARVQSRAGVDSKKSHSAQSKPPKQSFGLAMAGGEVSVQQREVAAEESEKNKQTPSKFKTNKVFEKLVFKDMLLGDINLLMVKLFRRELEAGDNLMDNRADQKRKLILKEVLKLDQDDEEMEQSAGASVSKLLGCEIVGLRPQVEGPVQASSAQSSAPAVSLDAKQSAVPKEAMLYKKDQTPKAPGAVYDSDVLIGSEGGPKVSGKSTNDTIKGVFCSVMNLYMQQPSWEEILAVSVYQMGSTDHIGDVRSFLSNTLKCTASEKLQIDKDWPVCVDINTLLGDHLDELGFTFAEVPRSQTSLPSFTDPFITQCTKSIHCTGLR